MKDIQTLASLIENPERSNAPSTLGELASICRQVLEWRESVEKSRQDREMNGDGEPDYFCGCEHCDSADFCLNVERSHWMICTLHKQRWCVGANLFSSWKSESEEDWFVNSIVLQDFSVTKERDRPDPEIFSGLSDECELDLANLDDGPWSAE